MKSSKDRLSEVGKGQVMASKVKLRKFKSHRSSQKFFMRKIFLVFMNFMKDQLRQLVNIALIKNKRFWGPSLSFFDVDHSDLPFIDNMS